MNDKLKGSEDPRLAQALEYANTLLRSSPDGILAVDLDLRITEWNLLMEQMCGKSRDQAIGQDLADIPFMKETGEGDRIREGLEGKSIGLREVAYRIPGEDTERFFESVMAPLQGPAGQITGAVLRVRDITERKRVEEEEAVIESENRLRAVLETVQAGIVIIDPEAHRIVDVNPFAARMFGAPKESIIGAECHKFICPAERNQCPITDLDQTIDHSERAMLTATGERREIIKTVTKIQMGGRPHLLESFIDSTERKQSAGKIQNLNQALEEKVRQLLETREKLEQHRAHLEQEVARQTAGLTEAQRIAHLGNWEWDITNDTLSWSDEIYRIFGLEPQQFDANYEAFLSAVHPEDRQLLEDSLREALARQPTYSIEHRILQPDGTLRHVHEQAEVIRGKDGQPISMLGTVLDITERKQAEQALHDSESRYRNLIETTLDWVWEVDENAVYTYVSPRAFAIIGYQPEELIGKTPFDLMAPEEAERVANLFGPLIASQQPIINLENTYTHKDGHPVVLETSGTPVTDTDGKFCGYRGIDRDITERKQIETELRKSEYAYRTLSQNLPCMVYRVHLLKSGRMQFYNDMPVQITGYGADELTTGEVCSIEPLILDEDRSGVMAEVRSAIAGKRAFVVEYRLRHKDGGIRWLAEHGMPVYETDGTPLYIDGVIFDITEQKQAETKLKLFRSLLDNSSDAIEVMDPVTLRLQDINETECRNLGYNREELLSMKVTDIDVGFTADQVKKI
ncbi:MAG: hypothetical protein COW19_00360 [Zetaproteobacteria bacterium CG12_big_fil_rev_8_21_14_0_65_55_1124]|nr:MAG: hypothetical protein AUJ58_01090 [Zetaproteobacteria bacterium CG1_02_55_237]PIS18780.1 MAG: hypothetical protein COT53_08900 [Zetaproteobacteria bacterium CG08_land_8_20_14_0_20_55_17]PIW43897.1 MAG: hypothetical protein COW19_00360 [Zetaproteobacteria bacterium CG12_big_fil_rev_8_21_14_0_65_55_1124]PIY54461.1 MAG: hypothetical protein COZ01_00055 [Zetaproteobacteria bacterium CG_4_10_14_0_8_um_filter_55_43]PIZ38215.1 MAG: hypothetical protein COY36_06645 [Zetaproteobacteria bacterium 